MATETISSNDHLENFDQEVQNLEITDNNLECAIENEVPQVPQVQEDLVPVDENPDDAEEAAQAAPQLRFDQVYTLGPVIGRGNFNIIRTCQHRQTGQQFSVKVTDVGKYTKSPSLSADDLKREAKITTMLKHSNIQELIDVYTAGQCLYMVFELMEGKDLLSEIIKRVNANYVYSEAVASHYLRQMFSAVAYIQSLGVVHRDVQPNCFVFHSKENSSAVKLTNFNHSVILEESESFGIPVKNPSCDRYFQSPESYKNEVPQKSDDAWSMGILTYLLIFGRTPFHTAVDSADLKEKIVNYEPNSDPMLNETLEFPGPRDEVSTSVKEFLKSILSPDKTERLSVAEALQHSWLSEPELNKSHLAEAVLNIKRFSARRKLRTKIMNTTDLVDSDENERDTSDAKDLETLVKEIETVDMVLDALNQIAIVSDMANLKDSGVEKLLNLGSLRVWLKQFDRIYQNCRTQQPVYEESRTSTQLLTSIEDDIKSYPQLEMSPNAQELSDLLKSHKLQALLKAHDAVINDWKSVQDVAMTANASQAGQNGQVGQVQHNSHDSGFNEPNKAQNQASTPQNQTGYTHVQNTPVENNISMNLGQNAQSVTHNGQNGHQNGIQHNGHQNGHQHGHNNGQHNGHPNGHHNSHQNHHKNTNGHSPGAQNLGPPGNYATPATHIRKIQFHKHNDEPLGITLKMTEDGTCVIARVFHGGLIHRQGTLHAGDQIREINNYSVSNKTIEELQTLLKSLRGNISFKVVPSLHAEVAPVSPERPVIPVNHQVSEQNSQNGSTIPVTYLKCLFDYDPIKDDLIPCAEAGMRFSCGDIIQITIKDEPNWWQAKSVRLAEEPTNSPGHGAAGLVPSPQFQQWRMSCEHVAKKLSPHDQKANQNKSWFGWSGNSGNQKSTPVQSPHTPFALSNHSNFQQNSQQEPLEIQTYEDVVRVPNFRRKCLVLIGAHGVGRRHIKSALIEKYGDNFSYPIPFTSRPCRRDEQPGQHFNFCGHDEMLMDIRQNKYLEYGSHDGALYGTKLSSITEIVKNGKLPILDIEASSIKTLVNGPECAPLVVFVAAPVSINHAIQQDTNAIVDEATLYSLQEQSDDMYRRYRRHFDIIIINNDPADTVKQVVQALHDHMDTAQWIPQSWVY